MNKLDYLVLYHAGCKDGFASAWAFNTRYSMRHVMYVPMAYGDKLSDETWKRLHNDLQVFLLDYSMPVPELERIASHVESVTVLDHHKTLAEALRHDPEVACSVRLCDGNLKIRYAPKECGATMTWAYLFPDDPMPLLLKYVKDRDLWTWELPMSREINAYIGLAEHTFISWDILKQEIGSNFNGAVKCGDTVNRRDRQLVEILADRAYLTEFGGWPNVPTVNSPVLQSEICEELLRRHKEAKFACCFEVQPTGIRKYSLRSRKGEFDVSEVAKKYGGGGHAAAAGCVIGEYTLRKERGE